ncbi:hypothetical protein GCM10025867_26860 [Frondihabitans sucicola]|uniref:Cell division protein FtsZ C-terminal domain-containing protein n=1 Tax=Frondihabitans sucicola TaxID=1268041 RepID=A0ABM8GPQ9_9MICO|nr:hypothetical protein GCM10025867_26860 [Frondihabitans sucicola]
MQEAVHPEANIIFGAVIDDTLGDEVRVTVIAAGFDGGEPSTKVKERRSSFVESDGPATTTVAGVSAIADSGTVPSYQRPEEPATQASDPVFDDGDDDLDVPDFLK